MTTNTRPTNSILSSLPQTSHEILPYYPTLNIYRNGHLLLANVPIPELNEEDLERRSTYGYHQPSALAPANDHERHLFFLSRLWNIDKDILEFNFQRFLTLSQQLAIYRMQHFNTHRIEEYFHEDELAVALEFYLQFDKHLFFMKTCSYRGAEPLRDQPRGLFSGYQRPHARYPMKACQKLSCCLCYPSYTMTYRHQEDQALIRFGPQQEHYFLNGYRSILNCPASCTTKNIIYVLTCPCQKFEYIGETSLSLADRLTYHQTHGNRLLQAFLIGETNMKRIDGHQTKSFETLVKARMKLYQHFTQCSSVIQWFLDENPHYWVFVPEKITDTQDQEIHANEMIFMYANDVPTPPEGFRYSQKQKQAIDRFFHEQKYLHSPNLKLDLYHASIIALVPDSASDTLRRWIEALFITYTEAKLNTIGHLDQLGIPLAHVDSVHEISSMTTRAWCDNLVRRPFLED